MRHGVWLGAVLLTATGAAALDRVDDFGPNPGNLLLFTSRTAGDGGQPLVVLLHGCGGGAQGLLSSMPSWEALATAHGFGLALPQQQAANNAGGCFNWFLPEHQARDGGEAASIAQMVRHLGADPARTYVFGFSAGAATAVNLLAVYPDLFAAGAVAAGVPFGCAASTLEGFGCMSPGVDRSGAQWAAPILASRAAVDAGVPRLAVWHGLSDSVVRPLNRVELIEQWAAVHGTDTTADDVSVITSGGQRSRYAAGSAGFVLELNEVPGVGHQVRDAWAADIAQFFGLAAPPVDAGIDAGAPVDAGPPVDAGVDAGPPPITDGGVIVAPDAGARVDAGTTVTPSPVPASGCGVALAPGAGWLVAAVLAAAARRRRASEAGR